MAKLELYLTTGYVTDWGLWEGVREIIQNSIDAEIDGYSATITHRGKTLSCSSAGVKLDRNVWLLGTSNKADDSSNRYIGHFGEGLKLGILALVRAGHKVRLVNDDESWTPTIEPSSTFAAPVLTIRTRALPKPTGAFTVEVDGVSAETWREYRELFLHLTPPQRSFSDCLGNRVLEDPAHIGRLYVKGVFVQELKGYAYGYNLASAQTDRDRRMVDSWALEYHVANTWLRIVNEDLIDETNRNRLTNALFDQLNKGTKEFSRVHDYAAIRNIGPLVARFHELYGDDAVAIYTDSDRREAEHHGIKAVTVDRGLALTLNHDCRTDLHKVIAERQSDVSAIHPWNSLTHRESFNFATAIHLFEAAAKDLGLGDLRDFELQVVDFYGDNTLGQFHREGGEVTISIARKCLLDLAQTIQVIGHELAHHFGGDGDVNHERAEGMLFSKALAHLFQASTPSATPARELVTSA